MQGICAHVLAVHTIVSVSLYNGSERSVVLGPTFVVRGVWSYVRGPWSKVWSLVIGPDIAMVDRGADRGMAWALLEQLYPGFNIREERTEPFAFKINRVCGVSDRLTGSPGSTYVFCLRATLLWLLFCL